MNSVEVSVIVLTYYHEQYLRKALDSVVNQKCSFEYEVLISDDLSADGTLIIANEYQDKYPNKVFVNAVSENVGTCKNIYNAMLRSRGKYIVIMAGDDQFIDDYKLQKQVDFLKNNEDYFAVSTCMQGVFTDGEFNGVYPLKRFRGKEFTRKDFLKGFNYVEQGIMFRNIFDNEKAREDFSLVYKLSKYVEDLTLCTLFFDYGKIFTLSDVTYALTMRRPTDENQHNYNSTHKCIDRISDHISLLNGLNTYYGGTINFQRRYQPLVVELITFVIKNHNFNDLIILKDVPRKYLITSVIKGFPQKLIKKIVRE